MKHFQVNAKKLFKKFQKTIDNGVYMSIIVLYPKQIHENTKVHLKKQRGMKNEDGKGNTRTDN